MSRTTRVKINPREIRERIKEPRDCLGDYTPYMLYGAVIDNSKEAIYTRKKYFHHDGKAFVYHCKPKRWVYKLFNKIDRRNAKQDLKVFVKLDMYDLVMETNTHIPYSYL